MTGDLLTVHEVAALLGIAPTAVRSTMRRHHIDEQRGYPHDLVEALRAQREARAQPGARPGRGHRTDQPKDTT